MIQYQLIPAIVLLTILGIYLVKSGSKINRFRDKDEEIMWNRGSKMGRLSRIKRRFHRGKRNSQYKRYE